MTDERTENTSSPLAASQDAQEPESPSETESSAEPTRPPRRRLWTVLWIVALLIAVLVVPPLVSIKRYQGRITNLMAASLGRPVHLSMVRMRLLPRPGFVLYDLVVDEDPAYGAEPILHANSVTASLRLWSLWRGQLAISSISVDEASLNLVRTDQGRWNVDPLFRSATTTTQSGPLQPGPLQLGQIQSEGTHSPNGQDLSANSTHFPVLKATNSRINFKQGNEKLPFSLTNAEVSLSANESGSWRIRLRGEPVRTDLSMDPADTGELILDATLHSAKELRQVPIQLEIEWRKAQLGQLTRLVLGTDAGWRGDLTGNLSLTGTPEQAQVKTRLRASSVHRAEFVPSSPMDFDANCNFNYQAIRRAVEKLVCDSPIGKGKIHVSGSLRASGPAPASLSNPPTGGLGSQLTVELSQIPVAIGLDALRTIRAELLPDVEAQGIVNGKLIYSKPSTLPDRLSTPSSKAPFMHARNRSTAVLAEASLATMSSLAGGLTVDGLVLSGKSLGTPIQLTRIQFHPTAPQPGAPLALATTLQVPAGEPAPLTVSVRIERRGYSLTAKGSAATARALQLTASAGIAQKMNSASLQGGVVALDLAASGLWVDSFNAHPDHLLGTAILHNTRWNANFLANPVELSSATLRFDEAGTNWESASFIYGVLKGTGSVDFPAECALPCPASIPGTEPPPIHFSLQLGALNGATLEAALLGAQKKETVLEGLLARLRPSAPQAWPLIEGVVKADTLALGPITLSQPALALHIQNDEANFTALDARLLGGTVHATGRLKMASGRPAYEIKATGNGLKPKELGKLLGQVWAGSSVEASGDFALSGFTGKDLAATAHGTAHFDWTKGGSIKTGATESTPPDLSPLLARFDRWNGDATIAKGSLTLGQNQLVRRAKKAAVGASLLLGDQPKIHFSAQSAK